MPPALAFTAPLSLHPSSTCSFHYSFYSGKHSTPAVDSRPRRFCPQLPKCNLYPPPSSNPPSEFPPLFRSGELLNGRYRAKSPLGGGGQAVTWRAVDEHARLIEDEDVILKVLTLRGMGGWKALEMLKREARVLQAVTHKGVPQYVDYFEADRGVDRVFVLVQKRARGKSLLEWVESGWRFGGGGVEAVLRGILEVLDYLHGLKPIVVHRDVKPENVVIQIQDGVVTNVNLVDFGGVSGIQVGQSWGNVGSTVVGTFGYMAPEQLRGIVDARSDLYSTGATILFMLTGRSPGDLPHTKLRINLEEIFGEEERRRLGRVYLVLKRLLEPVLEDRVASASVALEVLDNNGDISMDIDPAGTEVFEVVQNTGGGFFNWGSTKRKIVRKPADSKVVVRKEQDGQVLRVMIPRPGLSSEVIQTGAFAIAWYGFLGFWVVGALTGGGTIVTSLFSLPFWFGGSQIVRRTADEYGSTAQLVIERPKRSGRSSHFQLTLESPLRKRQVFTGESEGILEASVECVSMDGGQASYALQLREGPQVHQFGESLEFAEQEYIAAVIMQFIGR